MAFTNGGWRAVGGGRGACGHVGGALYGAYDGNLYQVRRSSDNNATRDVGVPAGSEPDGMYMVTSGTHVNSGCCFDYGNSETTRSADAAGAMDAINVSTQCWFGGCSGTGPCAWQWTLN